MKMRNSVLADSDGQSVYILFTQSRKPSSREKQRQQLHYAWIEGTGRNRAVRSTQRLVMPLPQIACEANRKPSRSVCHKFQLGSVFC